MPVLVEFPARKARELFSKDRPLDISMYYEYDTTNDGECPVQYMLYCLVSHTIHHVRTASLVCQ